MYQVFQDISHGDKAGHRLAQLRKQFKSLNINGFIIPHADEFQGEYLPEYAERLAWLMP